MADERMWNVIFVDSRHQLITGCEELHFFSNAEMHCMILTLPVRNDYLFLVERKKNAIVSIIESFWSFISNLDRKSSGICCEGWYKFVHMLFISYILQIAITKIHGCPGVSKANQ